MKYSAPKLVKFSDIAYGQADPVNCNPHGRSNVTGTCMCGSDNDAICDCGCGVFVSGQSPTNNY